jgi:hypothetical protein
VCIRCVEASAHEHREEDGVDCIYHQTILVGIAVAVNGGRTESFDSGAICGETSSVHIYRRMSTDLSSKKTTRTDLDGEHAKK